MIAERQRARLDEDGLTQLFEEIELPLVDVLVEMERQGVKLDVNRLSEDQPALQRPGHRARARGVGSRRGGVHADRLTAAARPDPVREAQAARASAAARRASPMPRLRRPKRVRHEHPIIPAIEEWREVTKLKLDLPRRLPRADRRSTRACTPPSTRPPPPPAACRAPTPTFRTSPFGPSKGARFAACFVAEEDCRLISAD